MSDTANRKDFNAVVAARRAAKGEAPSFVLGPNDEEWHALPEVPAHAVFDFARAEGIESTVDFLAGMLVPDEREAFTELILKDADFIVSIDTLSAITDWLGEWYSGNEPKPSKP